MTEKSWKKSERRIAALLGGRRVPVSGRGRGDVPDIDHASLAIEVKSRKTMPRWLQDALEQAEASAKDGQLPVAIFHQRGQRYEDSLVVMRLHSLSEANDNCTLGGVMT